MAEWCNRCGVEILAYCLMPNHVHLIAIPDKEDSLAKAIGEAHRRYTRHINFRKGWHGNLWQGRFASYGKEDVLLSKSPLLHEMIDDWKEFLRVTPSEQDIKMLQQHERTGRPLGSDGFLTRLEKSIGRLLKPKKPGRKPKKVEK